MKKTPYFSGNVDPFHVGPYERDMGRCSTGFSLWNGQQWCHIARTPESAVDHRNYLSMFQNLPWRGLASKPVRK